MSYGDHTRDPWLVSLLFLFTSIFLTTLHASSFLKYSPWVILNDFGGAFAMGAVGGGIWHGIKGARNSPRVRNPSVYSVTVQCTV